MKQSHPTRKTFGEIFTLTFRIYFKNFWKNLGTGTLIAAVCLLFFVPYYVSYLSSINFSGYPFMNSSMPLSAGTWISYFLALALMTVFGHSLITGYFAPKTIDFLEQKMREKGERLNLAFQVFGRISSAQTVFFLIYMLLLAPLGYLIILQAGKLDTLNVLYGGFKAFINYFLLVAGVSVLAALINMLCVFTAQTALFEQKRWFGAFGKAVKTMVSGNFWITVGYFIVFGLVISIGSYFISIFIGLIMFLFGMTIFGFGMGLESFMTAPSGPMIAVAIILGLIVFALIAALAGAIMV